MSTYQELCNEAQNWINTQGSPSAGKYRTVNITICEVENGHTVDISWSFNADTNTACRSTHAKDFIARNTKEILRLINETLPTIKVQS